MALMIRHRLLCKLELSIIVPTTTSYIQTCYILRYDFKNINPFGCFIFKINDNYFI